MHHFLITTEPYDLARKSFSSIPAVMWKGCWSVSWSQSACVSPSSCKLRAKRPAVIDWLMQRFLFACGFLVCICCVAHRFSVWWLSLCFYVFQPAFFLIHIFIFGLAPRSAFCNVLRLLFVFSSLYRFHACSCFCELQHDCQSYHVWPMLATVVSKQHSAQ